VVELPVLGDRGVEDLLREVIGTDVSAYDNGIPSKRFDLVNDKSRFPFIEAAEIDVSVGPDGGENVVNVLADHNLRTLLGKDDSSTPSNSLRQTGVLVRVK